MKPLIVALVAAHALYRAGVLFLPRPTQGEVLTFALSTILLGLTVAGLYEDPTL